MLYHVFSQLNAKFDIDLKETLEAFKFARYFDPCKVTELKPTYSDVDN